MDVWALVPHVIFGGFIGFLGQLVRGFTTVKKVSDEARTLEVQFKQVFDWSLYIQSLIIGFVAGALAMSTVDLNNITPQSYLAIFAAGYSGPDFLLAFLKKKAPTVDQARRFGRQDLVSRVRPT